MAYNPELNEYYHQLLQIEEMRDSLPCGDYRAEMAKVAQRIREMLCEMEGALAQRRDVTNLSARISNLIKTVLCQ
jgi:polyhydroxyalkanoate synthesis regulator phasin